MELGRQQSYPALLWVTANNSWQLRKLHTQVRTKRRTKHLKMISCAFSMPGLSSCYLQEAGTWLGEGWPTPRASEGSQGHKPTPVWALVLCKCKPQNPTSAIWKPPSFTQIPWKTLPECQISIDSCSWLPSCALRHPWYHSWVTLPHLSYSSLKHQLSAP